MVKEEKRESLESATTDVIFATKKGKVIRINANEIPLSRLTDKNGKQKSRKPVGVRVMKLKTGDEITAMSSFPCPTSSCE